MKGQIENIFDLAGHMVSVTFTQLCPCSMESCHRQCTDNTRMDGRSKQLFTKTGVTARFGPRIIVPCFLAYATLTLEPLTGMLILRKLNIFPSVGKF